jgi:hypothetical protein
VTLNAVLSDGLSMVVAALAESDLVTARDCSAGRIWAQVRRPDVAFSDGRLPANEVLCLVEQLGCRTPPVRRVVLVDWDTPTAGLAPQRLKWFICKASQLPRRLMRSRSGRASEWHPRWCGACRLKDVSSSRKPSLIDLSPDLIEKSDEHHAKVTAPPTV